ncbi:zinc finger protein 646-like [Physella acuta]|uniref:zinc finger protein 646-like n=1 Tax=Physella acuta TaxID=109671 RepID=UPI0027DE7A11|nr:zinc finger protein 646-like [Physella acuta]
MPATQANEKINEEDIVDSCKGRGRRRLCKKCKFTCTDAREFTAHLATHSDIESKLDRLRRRRPSVAKTPDGPQSSSDMDSPTSAPLLLEDKEKLKNSFFETPESDALEVSNEANERDDAREDEGDEIDAMNVDTDEKKLFPHQMGVGENFSPEEEGEGKLVIDDAVKSGQIFPCRQCSQKLDGVKAFLQHLSEAHKVEDKIYKCDLCQYTNANKEKLARHRKKHFPSTADIFPNDSDESASMNKIQAEKNVYDDMDEEELAVPVTITNIDQRLDDDKKKKKKTRQEVDPGKYFETVDSSGTKYACSQCGNIYKWRKSLNKHWKEKHSSDPLVEVASPPGMLELLKSGKYTQLGARRIYDNVFLSTIKTNKDDNPIDNASPSSLAQSPSPPNFLNTPVSLSASRVVPSLVMPSMIGPFVAGSTQPVFPGMADPSNGYDSPEEGALDLTRDNKPDMSQFMVKQEFNSSYDQEQPLDFSKKKEEKMKHDKAWQDMKHAHAINQMIPKVHRCSKCEFTSMSEVDFANHTSSHLNKRIVKCNQCKVQINSMDELNNHFLKHHFQKLTEHKEAIKKIPHGLQQTYHLLKMDLQDIGELSNQDLGASEAKSLKCKKCEFEAKWPAELQKHAVSHSEERPYVCMVCGSTYKWKWDLVKHFQNGHPNLPNPYRRNDKRDTPDGSSEEEVEEEPEIKRQKMSNELINGCRDDHISVEGIIAATQAGQRVVSSQPNILDDEPNLDNGLPYLKKLQYLGNGEASQSNTLQMTRTPQEILEQEKNLQEAARLRQNSNSAKKIGSREQTSPVPGTSKAEELPYKCTMCNYHARWPSEVTQHMKNHSDSKPYLCPRCEYRSKWKWDVVKHLKRCGGGGINDVIDTTKARRRDLISHGPPNAIVSLQGKLKKLTGAEESGPASSSAQSSGDESRPSSRASTLDLSSNNNENSVTDNNYSNNGFASFNSSSNMNSDNTSPSQSPPMSTQPKQTATAEIWSCPHCPFTTASQAELKRHSGLHSDDKPFKCDVCQYSTRWAYDLKKHRKSYNHFPKPNKEDKSDNTQGRFKCSQCTLYFQTLQNLMEHRIAEHIGRESLHSSSASQEQSEIDAARIKHPRKPIKQIQCSKCPFVCKNRQTMEKHMEDHAQLELSGFQCFYCSSQFKEKEILLDHMSSHSAFNPKEWETFFMINEEEDQAKDERKEVAAVPDKQEKVLDSTEARIQQILSEIPKMASHQTQASKFRCEWCPAEFSNLTAVYKHASQAHPIQLKEQDVGTAASKSQILQAASNKKSYAGEPIEILKQQIAEKRHEQLAEKLNEMLSNNPKMQQIFSKGLEDGSKQFSCDKCSFSSANLATFQLHLQMLCYRCIVHNTFFC